LGDTVFEDTSSGFHVCTACGTGVNDETLHEVLIQFLYVNSDMSLFSYEYQIFHRFSNALITIAFFNSFTRFVDILDWKERKKYLRSKSILVNCLLGFNIYPCL
jgi:hypothetical protein